MPTFLVSTSAGSGGSIAPTSALLTAGGSQQFTVTAHAGFGVTSVTGCSAVFLGITYRVDAASAPCTFSATFAPLPSQTTERTILIALYNSTNGANWSNKTNWLGAVGTECTWFGVLCDATGARVVRIDLNSNNLRGSLPPIAGLTALQHFNVSLNQLTGSVPALTGMTSLESFKLTNNRFTGVLPDLSGLTALQQFYVIGNRLTGAIPNIPNPSALIAGGSSLCVNFFTPSVNSAWNAATGESPWFARCTAVPFVVTVSKTGNGQIMADSPQDKLPGSTIVVLAVPDVGHEVSMGGTCGGALVGAVFTSNPITADCTVIANFVPEPTSFTITPRVFGLGTVAPSTPQIVARGASVTFTVTLEPGRTYTAGGTCGFSGGTTTSPARENCFVDFTFTSLATLLDIDASGGLTKYDPATDGVMILRYLLGMTGDAITNGAMSATAVRSPELARIELNNIRALLDIDGNRRVEPLTDGVMIVRYMMGLRNPRVTAGLLGTDAARTPAEIDAYLAGLMP